jgi:hypothetical protein
LFPSDSLYRQPRDRTWQGSTHFPKIQKPPQNFKHQNRDTEEVTLSTHILYVRKNSCNDYTEHIGRYRGEFSCSGNHATCICASLAHGTERASCFSTTAFRNILRSEKYLASYVPDGHRNRNRSARNVMVCCCPNFNTKWNVQTKLPSIKVCENTFSSRAVIRTGRHTRVYPKYSGLTL